MNESPGEVLEKRLYNVLVERFGKNCVYRSPKVYPHGQEKELADILVLALPYAIAFQLKWKKMTSEDLLGERGPLCRDRLQRTLEKAAGQYTELASSLEQETKVEMPQVWLNEGSASYELPLKLVRHVVPIVVVDFEDGGYADPESRYTDIPPVVVKVPSKILSWGLVHCFLFKDFERILRLMFTVGDLLMWCNERSRLFESGNKVMLGCNELSLFAIYLTRYQDWERFVSADNILLGEQDFIENSLRLHAWEFQERDRIFGCEGMIGLVERCMVDAIASFAGKAESQDSVLQYLEFWGRILCCPCGVRKQISDRLHANILEFGERECEGALRTSYGVFDERIPTGRTGYCIGIADYTDDTAESYATYALMRMAGNLKQNNLASRVDEILVVLVRSDRPSVTCLLNTDLPAVFQDAMSPEALRRSRTAYSKQQFCESEWSVVHEEMNASLF